MLRRIARDGRRRRSRRVTRVNLDGSTGLDVHRLPGAVHRAMPLVHDDGDERDRRSGQCACTHDTRF